MLLYFQDKNKFKNTKQMHNGIPLSYGSEVEWKVVLEKILDSRKVLNTEKRNKLEDLVYF